MIRLITTALAVCALASAPAQAQEPKALLFEIEGAKPSYIFGTFSRPYKETTKVAAIVQQKLKAVDEILEESAQDQAAQQAAAAYFYLEGGKTLKDVLPEDTYKAVEARITKVGMPMTRLARFRPWVVAMQLIQLEFMEESQKRYGQGGTLMMYTSKKPKTGLLTFMEAAGSFAAAEMPDQVQIVKDVLHKLGEWDAAGKKPNAEWKDAYMAGDLDAIYSAWEKDSTGLSDDLNKRLIKATYNDYTTLLADRIAEKLKAGDKSYGILVSCHLLGGPESLISKLEEKGIKVKRVGE